MVVIFVPILQAELPNRAVTVIMDITSSGVPEKGKRLETENCSSKGELRNGQ